MRWIYNPVGTGAGTKWLVYMWVGIGVGTM